AIHRRTLAHNWLAARSIAALAASSGRCEVEVLRFDRAGRPPRGLMVAPVEIRVRDDEIRRRRAPRREILGGVRIADERRVIAANECAVQRRADAFVRLRADDDQAADGEVGEDGLERRLLERVRIPLLDERLALVRTQLRDDLPSLASLREVVA